MFNTFVQSLKIMMSAKHKDNDVSITEVNT